MIHTTTQLAKFKMLVRRLRTIVGATPVSVETLVVGLLERLWHATATSAPRGDIGRHDNELIAELVGWDLPAETLINALLDTGWLDSHPVHRLCVHDWHDHAPNYVKGNVLKKGGFISTLDNPQGPPPGDGPQGPPPRGHPPEEGPIKPNQTIPNQTIPPKEDSSEPSSTDSKPPPDTPNPDAVLIFPTVGKVKSWPLLKVHIADWATAYPGVDVLAECRKALAWVKSNPKKAKTAGGMMAFLNRWLSKANDSQPGPQTQKPKYQSSADRRQEQLEREFASAFLPPPPGDP